MKILKIVHEYRKLYNGNKTDDFNLGFNECLNLFEMGMKREGLINQGMLMDENEKLNAELNKFRENWKIRAEGHKSEIEKLQLKISALSEPEMSENDKAAIKGSSLKKYKQFIKAKNLNDQFSIFCNNQ